MLLKLIDEAQDKEIFLFHMLFISLNGKLVPLKDEDDIYKFIQLDFKFMYWKM